MASLTICHFCPRDIPTWQPSVNIDVGPTRQSYTSPLPLSLPPVQPVPALLRRNVCTGAVASDEDARGIAVLHQPRLWAAGRQAARHRPAERRPIVVVGGGERCAGATARGSS